MTSNARYVKEDCARRALLCALVDTLLVVGYEWEVIANSSDDPAQALFDKFGVDTIDATTIQSFSSDSLEKLELVVTIENVLDIDLPEEEIQKLMTEEATIKDAVCIITNCMEGKSHA